MAKRPDLYKQLLELLYIMQASGERVQTSSDNIDGVVFNKQTTGEDFRINQAIVIVDPNLWDGLSTAATKLVIQIQQEMKMNNVFWTCTDASKRNVRVALSELKQKGIIFLTEKTGVFIINPLKIRRGKPLSCIIASLNSLHHTHTSLPQIVDLRVPKTLLLIPDSNAQETDAV